MGAFVAFIKFTSFVVIFVSFFITSTLSQDTSSIVYVSATNSTSFVCSNYTLSCGLDINCPCIGIHTGVDRGEEIHASTNTTIVIYLLPGIYSGSSNCNINIKYPLNITYNIFSFIFFFKLDFFLIFFSFFFFC